MLPERAGWLWKADWPGHALGALAKVAGRQGAAPPGGSAAAEEREEGPSMESLAGKVPDLSWKVWTRGFLGARTPVMTGQPGVERGLGFDLEWDKFAPVNLVELKLETRVKTFAFENNPPN